MGHIFKLKYRDKENAKYEAKNSCVQDIDVVVSITKGAMDVHGVVDLSIMPGDHTHYNLRVQWQNKTRKYLHVQYMEGDWEVIIPRYMSPCFLKKHVETVKEKQTLNPHTAALICDLVNRICDSDHQSFYSWKDAVPMYILTESTPNGWEEEEEPCEE